MKRQLGAAVCENILFIHAVLGCDMTSRLYSLGKLKKFTTSTLFQAQSPQFLAEDESSDILETAGEKALVSLYKSKPDESLDSLRYKGFCEEVAVKKEFKGSATNLTTHICCGEVSQLKGVPSGTTMEK